MATPVIVGAVRTAIGRSFKGTLVNTPPETLVTTVLPEVVRRSGVDPSAIDDIIREITAARTSERGETRIDDRVSEAAMEDRKKNGYF